MRAIQIEQFGDPAQVLRVVDIEEPPPPGPHEVLVSVEVSPLNKHDLLVVTGDNGTVLTSTNGINWTPRPVPTTAFLSGVTAYPGGLVAVETDIGIRKIVHDHGAVPRRQSDEIAEVGNEVRLIVVAAGGDHVGDRSPRREELRGVLCLLDADEPAVRDPDCAAEPDLRGPFRHAAWSFAVPDLIDERVKEQQTCAHQPVDEDVDVLLGRHLPVPIVQQDPVARQGRQQRIVEVGQIGGRVQRQISTEPQLDAEELPALRATQRSAPRLRSAGGARSTRHYCARTRS